MARERYLLESRAWQSLSPVARSAYLELAQRYFGNNNGRIALSARTLAERLSTGRATASRALADLTDRGFIEAARAGGFSVKSGERRSTEWRLTSHRCDKTGAPPSKNFMRWEPGKIHFTASPQSQTGSATEPPSTAEQQHCRKLALT